MLRAPVIPLAARNAAVVPVIEGTEAISSLDCGPMKPGKSEKTGSARAMPMALAVFSSSRPRTRDAAAAAPSRWICAHICPLCGPSTTVPPRRPSISFAAICAVISVSVSAPSVSPTAIGTQTALCPVWPRNR